MTIISKLTHPADRTWLLARIASLLSPYFEKDTPIGVREMEADDWAQALGKYPRWAINNAVFWWKSSDNPNRRKTPMHGDIEDRVKSEMGVVKLALIKANQPAPTPQEQPEPEEKITDSQRAEMNATLAKFAQRSQKF